MTDDTELAKKDRQEVAHVEAAETIYAPAIDIREDGEMIYLLADMPGVDEKSVDVNVENGVLIVEGRATMAPPEGYELVGSEYSLGRFRRDFTLSEKVNVEGIRAKVRNGVLEVALPKREEVKTRKIEIAG